MNVCTPHADPEVRKERLLREALVNAGNPLPSAENIGIVLGGLGIALMAAAAFSGGFAEIGERAAALAIEPNAASATQSQPITRPGGESVRTEPEGNVQDLTY